MKKINVIVAILILATLFAIPVRAQESQEDSLQAKYVYIYDWTSFKTDVDKSQGTLHVQSDWDSVFCIDDTITIYSDLRWYSLGGRKFFVQFLPDGAQEANFVGEIDGFPQVIKIQFYGELVEINSRGIVFKREGMIFHKALFPKGSTGNWHFPERQGWPVEAPREMYSNTDLIAVTAEAPF